MPILTAKTNVQRIRRLSRWLAAMCLLMIIGLPIALIIYWSLVDPNELAMRSNLPSGAIQVELQLWQRLVGALVSGIPLGLLLLGLWQARNCFKLFAAGDVFNADAVRYLRRFAGWVMVSVIASVISSAAISALLTIYNPPTMRHLAIGIGSDQLFTLFFAGMVWLMAAVIAQGQDLAEENATFI